MRRLLPARARAETTAAGWSGWSSNQISRLVVVEAERRVGRAEPWNLSKLGGPHDPAHRPLADRAAPPGGPRSRRRERRPGADGRQVRRDVDADELPVPVVQLPQPPGRAPVLRPHRE